MSTVKKEASKIVERLPEDATWDDLIYQIYVRASIESGLKDSKEGRKHEVGEVRKKFGLEK